VKLSILIPFRDVTGERTRAKEWIVKRWAHFYPEAEIIEAPDDGVDPFNKPMAVNKAARQATGDMFAILDADTWIDPAAMTRAFMLIEKGIPWVIPAGFAIRLKREVSERIMALDPTGPLPAISSRFGENAGRVPVVGFLWVMPRAGFEAVGGMDERIRGWGGEDTSFTAAMDVVWGRHRKLHTHTLMSLWHERPRDERRNRIWLGQDRSKEQDKAALCNAYTQALRSHSKARMLEVLAR